MEVVVKEVMSTLTWTKMQREDRQWMEGDQDPGRLLDLLQTSLTVGKIRRCLKQSEERQASGQEVL